jgi:antitoxin YefM
MTEATSKRDEKIRSFWDRYINKLHESGIKPPFDRWMVLRAEHYIAAHADRRLTEQTSVDVNAYLAELGRKPGLKAWQFRQAVDAIQKLFELAGVSWLGEVDRDTGATRRGVWNLPIRSPRDRKIDLVERDLPGCHTCTIFRTSQTAAMQIISFSDARNQLKQVLDRVAADADYTVITRRDAEDAVVMSLGSFNSLMETVHLLRSPANAEHLARSIAQYRQGQTSMHPLAHDN